MHIISCFFLSQKKSDISDQSAFLCFKVFYKCRHNKVSYELIFTNIMSFQQINTAFETRHSKNKHAIIPLMTPGIVFDSRSSFNAFLISGWLNYGCNYI